MSGQLHKKFFEFRLGKTGVPVASQQAPAPVSRLVLPGQQGITGLETAIVLIAFVVVSSVIAFAVLSTGLLSSQKSTAAEIAALKATASALVLSGALLGIKGSTTTVDSIKFILSNATDAGEPVKLSTSGVNAAILSYSDANQAVNMDGSSVTWLTGSGPLKNPGEAVEITVPLTTLSPRLGISKKLTIELNPVVGPVVKIVRTTPHELMPAIDMQ